MAKESQTHEMGIDCARRWLLLSDGTFLRRSVSAVKNLPNPGRGMFVPFCYVLEKDIDLLVPTALYEGREWTLGDAVGGGEGQPC